MLYDDLACLEEPPVLPTHNASLLTIHLHAGLDGFYGVAACAGEHGG